MNLTPTHRALFQSLSEKTNIRQSDLLTRILELKLMGKNHRDIAEQLGYSKAYIDQLHSKAKRSI